MAQRSIKISILIPVPVRERAYCSQPRIVRCDTRVSECVGRALGKETGGVVFQSGRLAHLVQRSNHIAVCVVVNATLVDPIRGTTSFDLASVTEICETRVFNFGVELLTHGIGERKTRMTSQESGFGFAARKAVGIWAVVIETLQSDELTVRASNPAFRNEIDNPGIRVLSVGQIGLNE